MVATCRAIVKAVCGLGVDAADLEATLVADAEECAKRCVHGAGVLTAC